MLQPARKTRARWPVGTWMRLKSGNLLRALMDQHGKSLDDVARYTDRSKGFISHLTAGRCHTCKPDVAVHIAELLEVPIDVLFEVSVPTAVRKNDKQRGQVAA
jgi:transcriptional regulator with XRE-family HTH domain